MNKGYWIADDLIIEISPNSQISLVLPGGRRRVQIGTGILNLLASVARSNLAGVQAEVDNDPSIMEATMHLESLGALALEQPTSNYPLARAHNLSVLEWGALRISQVGGCFKTSLLPNETPPPAFRVRRRSCDQIFLPEPKKLKQVDLWAVISLRRTRRGGPKRKIELEALSALLKYTSKVQAVGNDGFGQHTFRPVASGGARHPLEVYVVANRVQGLGTQIYHYDPLEHGLGVISISNRMRNSLERAVIATMFDQSIVNPALILLFTAIPSRTACKYDDMALTTIMKDVGCLTQQCYLLGEALELNCCAAGGGDPFIIEKALLLDTSVETYVGGFMIW